MNNPKCSKKNFMEIMEEIQENIISGNQDLVDKRRFQDLKKYKKV